MIAGTASAVGGRVNRRQQSKWQEQEAQKAQQAQQAQAAPAAAPASGTQSTIDQLKELAELKNQGVLTEEEFAAQKAKLLG